MSSPKKQITGEPSADAPKNASPSKPAVSTKSAAVIAAATASTTNSGSPRKGSLSNASATKVDLSSATSSPKKMEVALTATTPKKVEPVETSPKKVDDGASTEPAVAGGASPKSHSQSFLEHQKLVDGLYRANFEVTLSPNDPVVRAVLDAVMLPSPTKAQENLDKGRRAHGRDRPGYFAARPQRRGSASGQQKPSEENAAATVTNDKAVLEAKEEGEAKKKPRRKRTNRNKQQQSPQGVPVGNYRNNFSSHVPASLLPNGPFPMPFGGYYYPGPPPSSFKQFQNSFQKNFPAFIPQQQQQQGQRGAGGQRSGGQRNTRTKRGNASKSIQVQVED